MKQLNLHNVDFTFHDTKRLFLTASEVRISSGLNYLIGKNGSGKSSFLCALSGLHRNIAYAGHVSFSGSIDGLFSCGFVSQNPNDSIISDLTFLDNIIISGIKGAGCLSLQRLATKKRVGDVRDYLKRVSEDDSMTILFDRPAGQLSGGEKQLLAILMRSYRGSDILLLDEVTANLDEENSLRVMRLLVSISEQGKILIFATHQHHLMKEYPGCIYLVQKQRLTQIIP